MHFELSIINGKTVFDIIRTHRDECIEIVRNAYLAHARGQSVNPPRYLDACLGDTGGEIEDSRLYDTSPAEREKFRSTTCRPERHRVTVAPDVEQLVRACDLILFATAAATPHIADPALFAHNPLVLHISLRDLAAQILLA